MATSQRRQSAPWTRPARLGPPYWPALDGVSNNNSRTVGSERAVLAVRLGSGLWGRPAPTGDTAQARRRTRRPLGPPCVLLRQCYALPRGTLAKYLTRSLLFLDIQIRCHLLLWPRRRFGQTAASPVALLDARMN